MHIFFSFPASATPSHRRHPTAAFTLIELLTVIAIIGVLAAILIPTVGRARRAAHQATSSSNLRQLGIAFRLYAEEHRGNFPATSHDDVTGANSWVFTLRPYLGNVDEVRVCPLDARAEAVRAQRLSSYALNEWLTPAMGPFGVGNARYSNLARLRDPTRVFVAFCVRDTLPPSISQDHTHSTIWTRWTRVTDDIDPDRFRDPSGSRATARTSGAAPYLFADGSVRRIEATTIKALADAGVNFAEPGRY
jgi:prepilin-type N-terminal cleavage/methylation domain-containing protein/prepilin-type processing-associated H-X9-DG protein